MAKRVNNVQETFAILARLEAERNQSSQKIKKGKRSKDKQCSPLPVSVLPQAPLLERVKHFTNNQDVYKCADVALDALENLPEPLSNSDVLIFDTLIEKLTKPRMLDFESDLVDSYGRVKRGIQVISKALDKKLRTFSSEEIIQAYGSSYSSPSGRIVDAINNIRVTAIKLELLSEGYRPSGSKIRTNVVLETDESRISSGKGASILSSHANELLSASIDLVDKAIKKGYEFQDVLSYVGTAKEFQLEPDAALTEKMCNLVQVGINSKGANPKSVEVCTSYMADKYAGDPSGKLPIIKLAISAKLSGIDFNVGARGFIAMKMKGCTIPPESDLLRLQWSHFCQGKDIPTILYAPEARQEHNRQRKLGSDVNSSSLLADTNLVANIRREELPIEAPVRPTASAAKREIVVIPKKAVSSEDLDLAVSLEIISRVSSIEESDRFKIRDEVVRILSDVRSRNPGNANVIDKVASECGLKITASISSKDTVKQEIKSLIDRRNIQGAFDLSVSNLDSGFNYEASPENPITTQRLIVDLQKCAPKQGVILATRALEAGMTFKFDTLYRTRRAFEEKISSCEDWGVYADFVMAAVDKGVYDFDVQRDEASLGIVLAELSSHEVQGKYQEKDFYDVYARQKESIRIADFLLDKGLVFKYEDARFNNLVRGVITSSIRLRRIGREQNPDPDSALKPGLDRFKASKIDLKSESSKFLSEGNRLVMRVVETGNKIHPATVNFMLTKINEEKLLLSENDVLDMERLIKQMLENNSSDIRTETLSAFVKHLVDLNGEDFHSARKLDKGSYIREPVILALSIAADGIVSGKSFGLKTLQDIYRLTESIDKEGMPKWMLDIISSKRGYLGKVILGDIKQVSEKANKKSKGNQGRTVYESPSSGGGLLSGTGLLERFGLTEDK